MNTHRTTETETTRDRAVRPSAEEPLRLDALLKELSGEDLELGMVLIDAATVGMALEYDPSNSTLRAQAERIWREIKSIVSHHLTSEDEVVLPWADKQPRFPHSVVKRARRQHEELRGLAKVIGSVSFAEASDQAVATAAKALYTFAARLDDVIAGEERDLLPVLRQYVFARR